MKPITITVKIWLSIGIGAVIFRTIQLFFLRDVQTGLVWLTKIVTDPLHDVQLYYKSPVHLLRGELVDPIVGRDRPGNSGDDPYVGTIAAYQRSG